MSKGENGDEINAKAELPNSNDEIDQNEMAIAIACDQKSPPPIFKLHVIAWDDVLDYLSFDDLISIGNTCKRLNRLAGLYFQENFHRTSEDNLGTEFKHIGNRTGLSEFIKKFTIGKKATVEELKCVESMYTSIKSLTFENKISLTKRKIECLKNILAKVKCIELIECEIDGDIYDDLLKFCKNLKSLRMNEMYGGKKWLLQKYPTLEHVQLRFIFDFDSDLDGKMCDEIKPFLEQNPNIRCLDINASFLLQNMKQFTMVNAKLDELSIYCAHPNELKLICAALNDLHGRRGFYQRLKLKIYLFDQDCIERLAKLPALENVVIAGLTNTTLSWPVMTDLKTVEFGFGYDHAKYGLETLVTNAINLESVFLQRSKYEEILLLVSHATKLKAIKVNWLVDVDVLTLNVSALNTARKNLIRASKVIIYLNETNYLATKWIFGSREFKWIEIRRLESTTWDSFDLMLEAMFPD